MDNRPIGMFDSGCGGLTVLKEYKKILPNENYIYFGDTARLPYGSKSKETIIEYSRQIINFLISQNVKLIIIACGTASSLAYEQIKNEYEIPIHTIISPTAKEIKENKIGIIATKGTIKSKAWEKEILKYNPQAKIISRACPLFVPIVEENFKEEKIVKEIIHYYLKDFKKEKINSLILGCTHYPLLEKEIQKELGNKISLINPGIYSVKNTKAFLKENLLETDCKNIGTTKYYSSDVETFNETASTFLQEEHFSSTCIRNIF